MAFTIKYVYQAIDKYTKIGEKVAKTHDKVRKASEKSSKAFNKSNRSASKSIANLVKANKGLIGVGAALLGLKKGAESGMMFQDAMANLSAITGAAGSDLDALKDKALSSAKAYGVWQVDVANAMDLVASGKPELLDNLDMLGKTTDQVLLLANASGMELTDSADAVVRGLNAFGKGAEFAGKFVNILAAGSKLGSSKIQDTAEAVKIAGGVSKAAGISFLELNSSIQVMSKSGFKASQAGTAFNSIVATMLDQFKADFSKQPFADSLIKINNHMKTMGSDAERTSFLIEKFGKEHFKVAAGLVANAGAIKRYNTTLKGTNIAQEQAGIRTSTMSFRLKKLFVIINEKVIKAFDKLEPTFNKIAIRFADWLDTLDNKDIEDFATSVATLAEALASLVVTLAKVADKTSVLKDIGKALPGIGQFMFIEDLVKKASGGKGILDVASTGALDILGSEKQELNVTLDVNDPNGIVKSTTVSSKGKGLKTGANMVGAS